VAHVDGIREEAPADHHLARPPVQPLQRWQDVP
jgi:hypothetical protein